MGKRFIDNEGNVYRVDTGNNLFMGKKSINPDKDSNLRVKEATEKFIEDNGLEPLSLVVGHVPKFEYGYGENKVVVNTGLNKW